MLREAIADAGRGFVLAVPSNHTMATAAGDRRVVELAVRPDLSWNRIPAGHGVKGPRLFDWALIEVPDPALANDAVQDVGSTRGYTGVLIRRARTDGQLTFYRVHAPAPVPVSTLVHIAGIRWRIEEAFASGKELTGLDEHQVRSWTSWHRWTLFAMLVHAFLSITALHARAQPPGDGLIPITRNEIRHLLTRALAKPVTWASTLAWSHWRRAHQRRHQPRPSSSHMITK